MSFVVATVWYPSADLFSPLVLVATVLSGGICFVATRPRVRSIAIGEALMLFGAPILFGTVFILAQGGVFLLGVQRVFPDAADMLATNIALGAGYLLAREATHLSTPSLRIIGWIEAIGFAMLAGFEFYLLGRTL